MYQGRVSRPLQPPYLVTITRYHFNPHDATSMVGRDLVVCSYFVPTIVLRNSFCCLLDGRWRDPLVDIERRGDPDLDYRPVVSFFHPIEIFNWVIQ